MKKLLFCLVVLLAASMTSCSSNSAPNDNTAEGKAVKFVKKQLKKNGKLLDYQIVNGQLPVEIMADEFKAYRDAVFKARLDYRACQVRGLKAAMEQNIAKIQSCQELVKDKVAVLSKAQADSEYVIMLATVEEKGRAGKFQCHLIAAFNPETLELEKWLPITTPVKNNAIMIVNALNNSLLEADDNQDMDSLAAKTTDPVVQFILKSTPK